MACFRPLRKAKGTGTGRKSNAHNSCAQLQIFEVNQARQALACDKESERFGSRQGKALLVGLAGGQSGRLTKGSQKTKSRLEEVIEGGNTSSAVAFLAQGV